MGGYILRRVLWAIPLLFFVSVVVYGLLELSPGGPTAMYLRRGGGISPEDIARMEAALGLNDPFYLKYLRWLGRVLQGDFGMAVTTSRPVSAEIMDRLPNTLYLMAVAWAVSILVAVPIGILSAVKQYSKFDHFVTALTFVGQSIPSYFLGLILLLIFYMRLDNPFTGDPLLPSGGVKTIGADLSGWDMIWDRIRHLILPVAMLTATWIAWYSRFLRASMLETIHLDYVRTARAKGVRERAVILRHAFRNAAIPLVTIMALDLPLLFAGALYAEVIFSWPGMGRLFFQAAERRDYGLLMAIVMITSFLIIVGNLLADIAYRLLDPRIKLR
jgi:peptide/nickel transport system permease protein